MPSKDAIEYAKPLCLAKVMTSPRKPQHGVHHECYSPLAYHASENVWTCPTCGSVQLGEDVGARVNSLRAAA